MLVFPRNLEKHHNQFSHLHHLLDHPSHADDDLLLGPGDGAGLLVSLGEVHDHHEVGLLGGAGGVGVAPAEAGHQAAAPVDRHGERVEDDGGRGDLCVTVAFRHTQEKPELLVKR